MSRSGYSDCLEQWTLIRWRGAVASAIKGKRGQEFLREMLVALDTMPQKRLIRSALVERADCCAMGAVAQRRKLDVEEVDPYDREDVADMLGIAPALAAEIAFINDDDFGHGCETPEERWRRVREWVIDQIKV